MGGFTFQGTRRACIQKTGKLAGSGRDFRQKEAEFDEARHGRFILPNAQGLGWG